MEQNQQETTLKYKFYKDPGLIIALLVSLLLIFYSLRPVTKGYISFKFFLENGPLFQLIAFLVVWTGWILFKKGKKWSFVVGFVLALVSGIGVSYIKSNIYNKMISDRINKEFTNSTNKKINNYTPTNK